MTYDHASLFMGSCFADAVGSHLSELKFKAAVNPTGIGYNPYSLADHLDRALTNRFIDEASVREQDGIYFHPDFHGRFNTTSKKAYIDSVNGSIRVLGENLKSVNFIFLTFGTSIAFKLSENDRVVNNCHKMPSGAFKKVFLNADLLFENLQPALKHVFAANPDCKVFLTVSPIRHLRHGAVENQRSKSALILLCARLEEYFERVTYLPVYELVMDELRDYRFYRHDDLIHLNEGGLNVIRNRFMDTFCDPATLNLAEEVKKWLKAKAHRPALPESSEHMRFQKKLDRMTSELETKLPGRIKSR